uniref:UDP-glycosyltransferase 76C2-like n=1 Tax=Erigeron canadensis TaxID=72917 RepID=UPI001CB957D6|nr:UDP-glycosyltransferase 76C2-like [Erigeron canadensis]
MSTEPSPNNRRLVLFPLPFQGHINPMLQLANILHTKGFKITIIHTDFNIPNQTNYRQFTFKSISDGLSKTMADNVNLDTVSSVINFMNKSYIPSFRNCLATLLEQEPVACLISDALWHFTQSVADSLKLPRIILRTSNMSCMLVYAAFPVLDEKSYFKTTIQEEPIKDLAPMTTRDIVKIMNGDFEEGKLELISSMIKETKAALGIIWNTFKELEEPEFLAISESFQVPSFPIGPFHKYFTASSSSLLEQDRSYMLWLDRQPISSVLYVSFGSVVHMGKSEFTNMAWGLANSKQRFLWVVRPASVSDSEWLESLPTGFMEEVGERGCIIKWAPQQEVLAHQAIGGFWTHNGWNSTLESICEGVPMICSPCAYDQPINARYVTDVWRIGVMLDNMSEREEIERAIKRVIIDKEGIEMRQRSKSLQKKVNLSLEKGGSANQSLDSLVDYLFSL